MKFCVNENCIGCTLCASTVPEVYTMTDEGTARAMEGDVPGEFEEAALEAMENCPADAIEQA